MDIGLLFIKNGCTIITDSSRLMYIVTYAPCKHLYGKAWSCSSSSSSL